MSAQKNKPQASKKNIKNNKKKKNAQKNMLIPILLVVAVVAIVIVIIAVTQGNKGTAGQPADVGSNATPELIGTKMYSSEPPMLIDTSKKYTATVKMAKGGEFAIELYADKAPITVNSFVFLARQGYFDGVTFHRVLAGFMAQTGDPTGTGGGGPGYQFEYEANDLKFDKPGVVAMANTGPATPTNGSQFFITFDATPNLNGGYTIFGQVISGMDVVNAITLRDPLEKPDYTGDVIESITITEE